MAKLRVIDDGPGPGAYHMRRDAALLAEHRPGDDPILRLYRWSPAAVSIGYNQREDDFDTAAVTAAGYDLVRRPTGGRAILHAAELTYCVVGSSPSDLFGATLNATYLRINVALLAFLSELGIVAEVSAGESREQMRDKICFVSAGRHEIRVAGRKLIGSAQRRTAGSFLQHGSILTGPDHAGLAALLRSADPDPHRTARLLAATTDLSQLLNLQPTAADYRAWSARLVAACAKTFALETVPWVETRTRVCEQIGLADQSRALDTGADYS
jgi:lipoate-protein ligase A